MHSKKDKDFPDLSSSGDLAIRDGDFVIKDGDFALEDRVEAHIGLYHHLARQNWITAQQSGSKYAAFIDGLHSDAHPDLRRELAIWLEQWTVPSVVFSALCVEALLNYYGANRLGPRFTERLERQSASKKLEELPRLVAPDSETSKVPTALASSVSKLFQIRNRLVHFKTSVFSSDVVLPDHRVTLEDSEKALEVPSRVCDYIRTVDSGFKFAFSQDDETQAFEKNFANTLRWYASFLEATGSQMDDIAKPDADSSKPPDT